VSPNGSDAWSGRLADPKADKTDGPFATLERARDEIRKTKTTGGLPVGGARVLVRGGAYERMQSFDLAREDSGTAESPIVYQAYPSEKVWLTGGKRIENFNLVTDSAVLARLPEEARGKVVWTNLKTQGISDLGGVVADRLDLVFDEEPMTLARYPNDGFLKIVDLLGGKPRVVRSTQGDDIGKFTCDSDRLKRWPGEKDVWVHGYWYWDWADERHQVKAIDAERRVIEVVPPYHRYGYRKGQWFYALNLLSEIDQPGEWYLDRETGDLFFYPPSPTDTGAAVVSVAKGMVEMDGVSHVTFERIGFQAARGTAITMQNCSHCRIVGCTIRNMGGSGVAVSGGEANSVYGCDIYKLGNSGISLRGGNRTTLTPANHVAENNHIHHYGLWNRMYQRGIGLWGVGLRAAHNLIHHAPHQAIGFSGNDNVMEFNEIHSVCLESNDAGAIYAGRDWTQRGTIIRHNYMHHISGFRDRGCVGVYLDDMYCGTEISGNVFHKATRAAFIGGGRDNVVENNIFVDCPRALHIDARALGWAHACADRWIEEAGKKGTLSGIRYKEPPYSVRWPQLVNILAHEPKAPEGNMIRRNIFFGGTWNDINSQAKPYVTLEDNFVDEDPHFVDYETGNFQLRDDSPAYRIGFQRIPIDRIGLYNDPRRASWPVTHAVP